MFQNNLHYPELPSLSNRRSAAFSMEISHYTPQLKSPREMLQEQWRNECASKRQFLCNFLLSTQDFRNTKVNLTHLNNYFKLPIEKLEQWPKEAEILELFEKVISRRLLNKANMKNWSAEEVVIFVWVCCRYALTKSKEISALNDEDWLFLCEMIPGKSWEDCKYKWLLMARVNLHKNPWTPAEDMILTHILVSNQFGKVKWKEVAWELHKNVGNSVFRSGKQCRERWNNYLDPKIKKGSWTMNEDILLLDFVKKHGKKWAMIAQRITGRNENGVKNRFNSLMKRENRSQQVKPLHSNETLPKFSKETLKIETMITDLKNSMRGENEQKFESEGFDDESTESVEASSSKEKNAFFQEKQIINPSFHQINQKIPNSFVLQNNWEGKNPGASNNIIGFPVKNPNFLPTEFFSITRETQNLTYMKESLNLHQFFPSETQIPGKDSKPNLFSRGEENSGIDSNSDAESSEMSHEAEIMQCLQSSSSNSEETLSMDLSETNNVPPAFNLLIPGEKHPSSYNVCKLDPKSFAQGRAIGSKLQVALIDHEKKRIFLCGEEKELGGKNVGLAKTRIEQLKARLKGEKLVKKIHHS